jgi:NADH-quinone oxidoreductase subunit N
LAILGLDISEFPAAYYNNMIIVSKFSTAFSGLFIILTIFLVTVIKFYENHQTKISDFIAISIFIGWNGCHGVFWNLAMFFWE